MALGQGVKTASADQSQWLDEPSSSDEAVGAEYFAIVGSAKSKTLTRAGWLGGSPRTTLGVLAGCRSLSPTGGN